MEKEKGKVLTAQEKAARYNHRVNRIARILRKTSAQFDKGGLAFDVKKVPDSRLLARTIVENAL
jgi:hypothetical protein